MSPMNLFGKNGKGKKGCARIFQESAPREEMDGMR
jgi:hypothetical protein